MVNKILSLSYQSNIIQYSIYVILQVIHGLVIVRQVFVLSVQHHKLVQMLLVVSLLANNAIDSLPQVQIFVSS
jgi:hypothetical protein